MLLFALPAWYFARRFPARWMPFVLATLWVGQEYMRGLGPFGFPWNFLGHSQLPTFPRIAACVDFVGVYGLSWLIVYTNATMTIVFSDVRGRRGTWWKVFAENRWPISVAIILLVCSYEIYPSLSKRVHEGGAGRSKEFSLRVAVVQPNISQLEKVGYYLAESEEAAREADAKMTSRTLELLEEAGATSPGLFILPESSFNSTYFVYQKDLHEALEAVARRLGGDILFGADRRETIGDYARRLRHPFSGQSERRLPQLVMHTDPQGSLVRAEPDRMATMVSAFFVSARDGFTSTVYDKIHLVPFGETAPLFDKIPYFQERILMVGSYARGTEYTVFSSGLTRFGVMICFESTFASLARAYARRSANLLCVITNDGWYDPKYLTDTSPFARWLFSLPVLRVLIASGPPQHFFHSVFRAMETRLPVIRAANTGISAVILPTGAVKDSLGWRRRGTFVCDVPLAASPPTTLYVRYGDWFAGICALALLASWLFCFCRLLGQLWWRRHMFAKT